VHYTKPDIYNVLCLLACLPTPPSRQVDTTSLTTILNAASRAATQAILDYPLAAGNPLALDPAARVAPTRRAIRKADIDNLESLLICDTAGGTD
jgi:hypothetical protein